jgi:hypothetical protein
VLRLGCQMMSGDHSDRAATWPREPNDYATDGDVRLGALLLQADLELLVSETELWRVDLVGPDKGARNKCFHCAGPVCPAPAIVAVEPTTT